MFHFFILILMPLLTTGLCYFIKNLRLQHRLSIIVSALHLIFSLLLFTKIYESNLPGFFSTDALSRLFLLVLSNVYFWVVLVSLTYLKRRDSAKAQAGKKYYFMLLNFYLFANSSAILSNHFGMYWISAEATTLCVAPLIYYYRNENALEAMWKYLFLVSTGIAFAFIGLLFLTLSTKGSLLEGHQLFFVDFVNNAGLLNPVWLKASFIFIFVGLSTKIGIAPMHYADIDATSNSPSPVAALMSGSLRITALLGVLRIYQIITPTSSYPFARTLLITGAILSLTVAFIFMFKVTNYKRMLAYSSVEHLGIITLGIGIGGLAFVGAIYHLLFNSLNKVVLFFMAGNIHNKYQSSNVSGVFAVLNKMPITGWLFLAGFLAISGIPPFGIFFSELMIFEGILFSDQPWILAITMFLLLFIFINMGKTICFMLYRKGELTTGEPEKESFSIIHFAAIILLILMIAIAVFSPQVLQENILTISRDFGVKI